MKNPLAFFAFACAALLAGCGSPQTQNQGSFEAQSERSGVKAQESDMQDQMFMGP